MKTVKYKFDIKDRVEIIEIKRTGMVTGLSMNEYGQQYQIVYWDNAKRYSEWMYDWELKKAREKEK